MNISVILGHPNPDSFCHAIARVVVETLQAERHGVHLHDLHAEGFDPLMSASEARTRVSDDALVERHCAELAAAEGLVVVHPSWWGMPPAILKGWIDRVVRPGVAYELRADASGARTVHVPSLKVKTALVLNTSDLPPEVERTKFGDTLGVVWKTYIAGLSGIGELHRHSFAVMGTSTPALRSRWLEQTRTMVRDAFPGGTIAGAGR